MFVGTKATWSLSSAGVQGEIAESCLCLNPSRPSTIWDRLYLVPIWDKGDSLQSWSWGGHGDVRKTALPSPVPAERVAGFHVPPRVKGLACVCRYLHGPGVAPTAPASCGVRPRRAKRGDAELRGDGAANPHDPGEECSTFPGICGPERARGNWRRSRGGQGEAQLAGRAATRRVLLCNLRGVVTVQLKDAGKVTLGIATTPCPPGLVSSLLGKNRDPEFSPSPSYSALRRKRRLWGMLADVSSYFFAAL